MLYNQIDQRGRVSTRCDGGQDIASDFTFSHNVCGPGIGAAATSDAGASHYIQIGGITGVLADNNAFLGPMDPNYAKAGLHNNVFHVFGSSRDVEFSNNLMWHTQSRGQTILLEEDGSTTSRSTTISMSKTRHATHSVTAVRTRSTSTTRVG